MQFTHKDVTTPVTRGETIKGLAIAIAIAIVVFAIGIVVQEIFFPGHSPQEQALHLRWHVRQVLTAVIALDAGALYIIAVGRRRRSRAGVSEL
jgi:cation transporter-like permease